MLEAADSIATNLPAATLTVFVDPTTYEQSEN
jgi:hypothetical protein